MASLQNREQRDLFRGALEMMVLRSQLREPMHGCALAQHIKQRSNELLQVEESSLYPALQRLLREGLVMAEWENSASKRRLPTYRITPVEKKSLSAKCSASNECSKESRGFLRRRSPRGQA